MMSALTCHYALETVPRWAVEEFLRVCNRDTGGQACVVPLYEDGIGFAFGASISEGGIGFVAWMSAVDEAGFGAVFEEARKSLAAGLFLPRWREPVHVPIGESDAVIEVLSYETVGRAREYFKCVLFGVNAVAVGRGLLAAQFRMPVANIPHPSVRPHPAAAGAYSRDETPEVDNDQKYITFNRCVAVEEFERGTRVTLDQPIVILEKPGRRFEMSVVSAATGSRGCAGMLGVIESGRMSVDMSDRIVITSCDGALVLSSIAFAVWIVRGWYVDPYGRRSPSGCLGSFSAPFAEVGAATRIQRFWRRRRCDPNHPVGNKLLRLDYEKAICG
jgi:hypothetical protein